MFYCRAQQLLKWLASIWVPVLQLAATAEPGQSILVRRIGLEWERWLRGRALLNKIWQWTALLLSPSENDTVNGRQKGVQVRSVYCFCHYWHTVAVAYQWLTSTEMQIQKLAYPVAKTANGSREGGWSEGEHGGSWWHASSWSVLAFVR